MAKGDLINMEDLYATRMIILLENDFGSNEYRQVILTPEHFKEITALLVKGFDKVYRQGDLKELSKIRVGSEVIKLPENMEDFYEPEHSIWKEEQ